MIFRSLILIVFVLTIASCTLQKRKYTSGYYTHLSSANKRSDQKSQARESKALESLDTLRNRQSITASNSSGIILPESESVLFKVQAPDTGDCDVIQLKNNQEISCIVTEIGTTEIRYKKCDNPNGPTIVIAKSDVFLITYKNGSIDMINSKTDVQVPSTNTSTNNNQGTSQPALNTEKKEQPLLKPALYTLLGGFLLCLLYIISPFLATLGVIVMLLSVVLSIIALVKIIRNPKKYKGKGKAISFIILGLLLLFLGPLIGAWIYYMSLV